VYRTQGGWARHRAATQIRRAGAADPAPLAEFFAGLSIRTRYLRFFAPLTPTSAMLRYLCGGGPGHADALIAVRDGVIVGHAMAADRPGRQGEPTADIGVVVADACQGEGVGSALVRALISRAQARGVAVITMDVLPGNSQVFTMITSHWPRARTERTGDGIAVAVRLPRHRQPRAASGRRGPLPRRSATALR
jgi:GNAT superfamily N-acetyltransferase